MKHNVTEIAPGIRRLDGVEAECCIYLVEGENSALVIDTGLGQIDIKQELEQLTSLPYRVVNTHGHGDHSGGDMYFPEVYMSAAAEPDARGALELNRTVLPPEEAQRIELMLAEGSFAALYVEDGFVFDLGGRTLEAIAIPGHTSGCIALLDREDRLLFSGDCLLKAMDILLVVPQALTVSEYLASMERLQAREGEFDFLLTGHDSCLMPKKLLDDAVSAAQSIVNGTAEGERLELPPVFGDTNALRLDCGDFAIAYRPGRI